MSDAERCVCGASLFYECGENRCASDCRAYKARRDFIRMHASAIDAARLASLVDPDTMRPRSDPEFMLPAARVWELAKELWDAKPADC